MGCRDTVVTCMPAHQVVTLSLPLGRSVLRPPTSVVPQNFTEVSRRPPGSPCSTPFRGRGTDDLLCMGPHRVGSNSRPLERPGCAEDITRSSWWFTSDGGCFLINAGVVCLLPVAVNDQASPRYVLTPTHFNTPILIGRFRTGTPSLSGRRFLYGTAASHGPIECRAVHFLQIFPQLDDVVFSVACRSRRHATGAIGNSWSQERFLDSWQSLASAFNSVRWGVPRAHWPAGGRVRTATLPRRRSCNLADQGGFKAPPLVGVQANGRSESRKLVSNQYVGNFRGRLGARWIRLGPFLEGPRSSWPVFGTHRTFLASVRGALAFRVGLFRAAHLHLTPRVHRLPHAWPEIASLESVQRSTGRKVATERGIVHGREDIVPQFLWNEQLIIDTVAAGLPTSQKTVLVHPEHPFPVPPQGPEVRVRGSTSKI
ncbi:hypothetical protein T06_9187 [Trichinella sp. T6]|nr:hypothetical protein T06_9187 [Trichinella sp. T6]